MYSGIGAAAAELQFATRMHNNTHTKATSPFPGGPNYVKATNNTADVEKIGISFGEALSLSGDGQNLVVSSAIEAGGASGVNADRFDRSATSKPLVYNFLLPAPP